MAPHLQQRLVRESDRDAVLACVVDLAELGTGPTLRLESSHATALATAALRRMLDAVSPAADVGDGGDGGGRLEALVAASLRGADAASPWDARSRQITDAPVEARALVAALCRFVDDEEDATPAARRGSRGAQTPPPPPGDVGYLFRFPCNALGKWA